MIDSTKPIYYRKNGILYKKIRYTENNKIKTSIDMPLDYWLQDRQMLLYNPKVFLTPPIRKIPGKPKITKWQLDLFKDNE